MGDDIDSMLNEEEKNMEMEELREERGRARKGRKAPLLLRTAPPGIDDELELHGEFEPAELERIDHHAEERRTIEETISPMFPSSSSEKTIKKKIPAKKPRTGASQARTERQGSTRKQSERYSEK